MVFLWPAGSTTADLFLGTTSSHLDNNFTLKLSYQASGGPITVPVQGVLFNPALPVLPTVPPAPLNLSATAVGSRKINLAWNSTPGAVQYIVERSTDQSTWTVLSTNVTTLSYLDTGRTSGTIYYYRIRAASSSGGNSPYSATASAKAVAKT